MNRHLETDFKWKWIEPKQDSAMPEVPLNSPREVFMFKEPDGENLKRLRPGQYLRKEFDCCGDIKSATAYATSVGLYRLFINGKQADNRLLSPDITPLDKLLTYQKYDITSSIRQGANAIGAILTDGWHIGRIGLTGDSCQYADRLAFLMHLEIEYFDGRTQVISSDNSFKSSEGAIVFSDIYIGEKYDARLEPLLWSEPGFDDTGWVEAKEVTSLVPLQEQTTKPIVRKEHFTGKLIITPSGQKLYDIGQVIAGISQLEAVGQPGSEIKLEYSEVLDSDGNFFRNVAGRNKNQTDYYIFSGRGKEIYEPIGTFHGFRYIMACYDENQVEIKSIQAHAIRTDLDETAMFECSDERLNKLWLNTLWSQRGNMIGIPTDCPQRERAGFTGDVQIFIRAACLNMDMREFIRSWLSTVRLEQSLSGEVTIIAPNFPAINRMQELMSGTNTSSGWGDAIVIVPWEMYKAYGDISFLEENYEAMKKWLHFVTRWAQTGSNYADDDAPIREGHKRFLWDTGFHFGDWLIPSQSSTGQSPLEAAALTKGPIGTAYYANSAHLMSMIAKNLGKDEDATKYHLLAENIRAAYTKEFYLGRGRLSCDFQGVYVTALAFNMVPEKERDFVAKSLVKMIEENGNRLDTGFLSVSHLMDCLCDTGNEQTALKLLYQTQCPSWLYEVMQGATTVWERWDAIRPDGEVTNSSFNHYSFGVVVDWMMRKLAGINPLSPGYREVEISPMTECGLSYVSAEYSSIRGKVAVQWRIENDRLMVSVQIPEGIDASINIRGKRQPLATGNNYCDFSLL